MKDGLSAQEYPEEKLVGTGQFLTDKAHMARKVSAELEKVYNEKILPYKLYVKSSAKSLLGVAFLHFLIFAFFYFGPLKLNFNFLISFIFAYVVMTGKDAVLILLSLLRYGGQFAHSLLKLYRAEKLFKQVRQELHSEAVEGKVDISNLMTEFDEKEKGIRKRAEDIEKQKEKERQDELDELEMLRKKERDLIEKAKDSDI